MSFNKSFEQKEGSGALFRNEEKEADTHADWTGTITINGQQYWLNAWNNIAKGSGREYLGVTIKPKQARGRPAQQSQQNPPPQKTKDMDFDDDIPF